MQDVGEQAVVNRAAGCYAILPVTAMEGV